MKQPPAIPASPANARSFEMRLYGALALTSLMIVLVGFSRTFYLRTWFDSPPLSPIRYLHGVLMTAWYALFVAQVGLIRLSRADLHRRLGVLTALIGFAILPSGVATAIAFVSRMRGNPDEAAFAALIAGYDFVSLAVFGSLIGTALYLRRRPDVHKRLMLMASLSLLGPPLARLVTDQQAVWLTYLMLLTPLAIDTWRNRRLHPAFAFGVALIVVSSRLALHVAASPRWIDFCVRMLT